MNYIIKIIVALFFGISSQAQVGGSFFFSSGGTIANIGTLDCAGATHTGTLSSGVAATGVSSDIPYIGGDGSAYDAQTVNSTGITGLTASITAGNFAVGNGNLTYTISGTPSGNGLASFAINIGGLSCTLIRVIGCGAYTASGVFTVFACHNLGADTSLDPNTPVQGICGNYYQWGSSTVVADASTPATAIAGLNTIAAPDGSWSDTTKTANDPCPTGFRVPTSAQWNAVKNNNTVSRTGTWVNSETNFGVAIHLGPNSTTRWLTLPAPGYRGFTDGSLISRGFNAYYWTTTINGTNAHVLRGTSTVFAIFTTTNRLFAMNIRCVAE